MTFHDAAPVRSLTDDPMWIGPGPDVGRPVRSTHATLTWLDVDGPRPRFPLAPPPNLDAACSSWFALSFGSGDHATFATFPHGLVGVEASGTEHTNPTRHARVLAEHLPIERVASSAMLLHLPVARHRDVEMASFLHDGRHAVESDDAVAGWFALRFGVGQFATFVTFADQAGQRAHLSGRFSALLAQRLPDWLAGVALASFADVLQEHRGVARLERRAGG